MPEGEEGKTSLIVEVQVMKSILEDMAKDLKKIRKNMLQEDE